MCSNYWFIEARDAKIMSSSGKLFLKWNDFQETVFSAFRGLHNDQNLTDVTLVSGDGQHVESHKIVLASSSPLFMDLLQKQKHPHPIIYMKGTGSEDLLSMVEFFYTGEVFVREENLETFLGLATELRLKGFVGRENKSAMLQACQENDIPSEMSESGSISANRPNLGLPPQKNEVWESEDQAADETQPVNFKQLKERAVSLNNIHVCSSDGDLAALEEQVMSMMEKSENDAIQSRGKGNSYGKARICKVCGKEGVMRAIKKHIESKHIKGVIHHCNICGNKAKTRESLNKHITKYHNE